MGSSALMLDNFLDDLQRARSKLEAGNPRNGTEEKKRQEDTEAAKVKERKLEGFLLERNTGSNARGEGSGVDGVHVRVEGGGGDGEIVDHVVKHSDTIQGILLRYGCSLRELKRLNHMTSDRLTSYTVLKVPLRVTGLDIVGVPTAAEKEASEAVRKIRRARLTEALRTALPGLEKKEATFYLMDADWCMGKALQQYREDVEWEKENPLVSTDSKRAAKALQLRKEKSRKFSLLRAFRRWRKSSRAPTAAQGKVMSSVEMPLLAKGDSPRGAQPQQE